MDYYAYHVLDFDNFFEEPIHDCMDRPDFDRPAWIERAFSNAITHACPWADAVVKKYGMLFLGLCFGGPQVFNLAKEGSLIIYVIAHPATLSEDLMEIDEFPMLFSCAETNHTFPKETRRKVENGLAEHKKTYHFHISSGESWIRDQMSSERGQCVTGQGRVSAWRGRMVQAFHNLNDRRIPGRRAWHTTVRYDALCNLNI
ncbi:hypothetical protein C8R48DRAFT_801540 [Suillus tomentosus]|nr:hypothetical protein C8R48DRAFT_801540 [Suillus tomentosus]